MIALESKNRIESLITAANNKTGGTAANLTDLVQALLGIPDALIDGTSEKICSYAKSVREYAFYDHSAITTAEFPLATSVMSSAFRYCASLKTVNFPLLTSVATSAFQDCTSLIAADFPSLLSVATYAFSGCTSLKTINFPLLTSVGASAFRNCTSLTTADFPSLSIIGTYTFYGCTNLATLILRSEVMLTLTSTSTFDSTAIASGAGHIYVPAALVAEYQADRKWSTYASPFRALEDYTVDGTITGALDETKI